MKKHQHQLVTILVQLTKLWKMKRLKITMISLVSVFIYLFLILHVWFSVLLVNSPTPMNSTQNENRSIAESQHDLELSRIPRPAGQVPDDGAGRAGPAGLHVCHCGKECIRYENFLIDSTNPFLIFPANMVWPSTRKAALDLSRQPHLLLFLHVKNAREHLERRGICCNIWEASGVQVGKKLV